MKALIYLSKALDAEPEQIANICQVALQRNKVLGVTGYLYFLKKRYVQYIEGPESSIDELMASIRKDPRHAIMMEIEDQALSNRRFPNWAMKYVKADHIGLEHIIIHQFDSLIHNIGRRERWVDYMWSSVEAISKYYR